jgi:hypothetical protein
MDPQKQDAYDSMVNGLAAATSDKEAARWQYQNAVSAGDAAGMADAADRMATAASRMDHLQAGINAMDEENESQAQPQRPQSAQQIIDAMGLMETERNWAGRLHPSWVTTPRGQELLRSAYVLTEQAGYKRGSPEFFSAMEQRLGLPDSANHGLTKQELEHARWSNVEPATYAENKRKLAHLKSLGFYTNN